MQTLNREIKTNLHMFAENQSLCVFFLQTKMFGSLTLGLQCQLSDFTAQQMSKLCTDLVLRNSFVLLLHLHQNQGRSEELKNGTPVRSTFTLNIQRC